MTNLKEKTLRSTYWLVLTRVVFQIVSWGITLIVARVLSPSDYGLMGMAMVYVGFIELMSELGFGPALIQREEIDDATVSGVFWMTLGFSLGMIGLSYLISPWLASYFKNPQVSPLIRLLSSGFLISSLKVLPYNLLTRDLLLDRRSQAEIAGNLTASFVTLVLALTGAGVLSLIAGILIQNLITTVILLWVLPIPVNMLPDWKKLLPLIRFGVFITLSRILWYFRIRLDYFFGGRYLGSELLGYYSMAVEFATLPINKFNDIIKQVTFPLLSRLQNEEEAFREAYLKINQITALLIFPTAMGLTVVAHPFVVLFLTEKWLPAVVPLQILCIVGALRNIVTLIPLILNAKGRPSHTLTFEMAQTVLMALAFWIGVHWGLTGLSLAWLIIYPFISLLWFIEASRLLSVALLKYLKTLLPATLCTVIMAFAASSVVYSIPNLWLSLLLSCLTGVIVYTFAVRLLFPAVFFEVWSLLKDMWANRKKVQN